MARRSSGAPPTLLFVLLLVAAVVLAIAHGPWWLKRHPRRRAELSYSLGRAEPYPSGRAQRARKVPAACEAFATTCASEYFGRWSAAGVGGCAMRIRNGYPVPDPRCTPGGVDPSVSADVLTDPRWRTACVRNCQTSEAEKHVLYGWYGIHKPKRNSGEDQVCELDHLVPLELGGADGLGNIWPECGPDAVTLHERYFKVKDRVENYLADEVKAGRMPLATAQRGIAEDWTQYLAAANRYCESGGRC